MQKELAEMRKQAIIDIDGFQTALSKAIDDAVSKFKAATDQVILTRSLDEKTVLYQTTIEALGNITNDFQAKEPDQNSPYWAMHQKQVEDALDLRTTLLTKIVDIISDAVSGLLKL